MNFSLTYGKRVMMIVSSFTAVSSFDACATANMHGTSDDYQALLSSGGVGVVMLSMDGCGHCESAGPVFDRLAGQPEYQEIEFIKLDGTAHPDIMAEHKLGGFPSFLFIREGKVVNTEEGFDEGTFTRNLEGHKKGATATDMSAQVDAMAPVHEAPVEEEGILAKLKMLFVGLFEIIKNIFVTIFDWIMGLFGR